MDPREANEADEAGTHTHLYIKTHKAKCSPIKTGRGTRCESLSVALQRWRRAETPAESSGATEGNKGGDKERTRGKATEGRSTRISASRTNNHCLGVMASSEKQPVRGTKCGRKHNDTMSVIY